MKKIIRLTESDLARIVKRVISEQDETITINASGLVGKTVNLYRTKNEKQEDFAYQVKINDVEQKTNLINIITDKAGTISLNCTDSSGALMLGSKPLFNKSLYQTIKNKYCKVTRDKNSNLKTVPQADFASTGGNMGGMS
jgi:flagellar hook assembly protein FlgD